jgi:hypothetical protein
VALPESDGDNGMTTWETFVTMDTDNWVRSPELKKLAALRNELIEKHGVADPPPLPGVILAA